MTPLPLLAGHVASALQAHRLSLRQQGAELPPELVALTEWCAEAFRSGQHAPPMDLASVFGDVGPVMATDTPRMTLSTDEVAEVLGVSPSTVRREVAGGRLRSVDIRGKRRITRTEIERYLSAKEDPQ